MIWLCAAYALERVQMKFGSLSYNSGFNGYGMTNNVNQRTALAPMAYRVFVPWLIALIERMVPSIRLHRLTWLYEPIKIGLLALMMFAASLTLGTTGGLLLAVLAGMTFNFEYWDWMIEVSAVALALTGNLPLAIVAAILLALSKETAPIVALTYGLISQDWIGIIGLAIIIGCIMAAVRVYQGPHKMYCQRFMITTNLADLKALPKNRPIYLSEMAMTLAITAGTLITVLLGKAGAAWPAPLLILGAGWTMARAIETRVFSVCLLFIVMGLIR